MPFTDHIGLTSRYERKKAKRRKFFLRWIFLLGIFAVTLLFSVLIKRNVADSLSSIGVALPFVVKTAVTTAAFIMSWWHLCLVAIIVIGLLLELFAEEKGRLTLIYFLLLLVLSGLFGWAYHYTSQSADEFLKNLKEDVVKPIQKK